MDTLQPGFLMLNSRYGTNEILSGKKLNSFIENPVDNLGEYLKNYKPEPSPYEGKYVFIR